MTKASTDTATRFFIATDRDVTAILGIGHTSEEAIRDARQAGGLGIHTMAFDHELGEYGTWVVTDGKGDTREFGSEEAAQAHYESLVFEAHECTERLYLKALQGNPPLNWRNDDRGLADLHDELQTFTVFDGDGNAVETLEASDPVAAAREAFGSNYPAGRIDVANFARQAEHFVSDSIHECLSVYEGDHDEEPEDDDSVVYVGCDYVAA